MLETTLATTFIPGTNLKGKVAGANWSFLLPNLNLERVLCLGMPPSTTLTTLLRFSQEVIIIGPDSGQVMSRGKQEGVARLRPIVSNGTSALPLSDGSIDLVLIIDQPNIQRFSHEQALQEELNRLLKPEGVIYFELNGLVDRLRGSEVMNGSRPESSRRDSQGFSAPHIFWLTPLGGEMHTAVPLDDQETINYFLQHRLYSPSINKRTLKRLIFGRGSKKRSKKAKEQESRGEGSLAPLLPGSRAPRLSFPGTLAQTMARRIGKGILETMGRLEGAVSGHRLFGRFTRRYGLLLAQRTGETANRPPHYLGAIAQEAGIDLDGYGWGLAARGDYSSRKLLFFLFAPPSSSPLATTGRTGGGPTYIVKMVRDPIFNPRLENEYRALTLLQQMGIGDRETLPQVVFFGHHAGLAIVGETAIEGVPFRQQAQWTAECPYLHVATEWLIDLGAATANSTAANPGEVATGLETLFRRFVEIYQLPPEQRAFLADQIEAIGRSHDPFSLVFQHGDPGTWNAMATPSGRVAFLDWEAAEPQGMPLWDLFYFLRSYCVGAARAGGVRGGLTGFAQQFLAETPLSRFVLAAAERYCERTGLPTHLVEPLFHTCWMHRALKEATRLTPANLERGHYVNLLRLGITQRQALTLRQLFSLGPAWR